MTELDRKFKALQENIRQMERVLVAFSGGVDSTFLLKVCNDTLGRENVLAVTAGSPIRFRNAISRAEQLAKTIEARHRFIETDELNDEDFKKNGKLRCYYCKHELYNSFIDIGEEENINYIVDGTNADDLKKDDRPGLQAHSEFSIQIPLAEAGLSKDEIRKLSRRLDLSTWDQPSDTCLATRFAYGMEINKKTLNKLREVELALRKYDFIQIRARLHDSNTIRIEVLPEEMDKIMKHREEIWGVVKELGFSYVTLDLEGYRSGSMGEVG
jgi:uncharacterized protein